MARRHHLQRLASPSRNVSLLIHLFGVASLSASFNYLRSMPEGGPADLYGGHFQYLTILGLSVALGSFVSGALADITLIPFFFDLKNILSVCSAPLEVLISALYWGLSAIDPELVVPPGMALPLLPDVGFHLMPALLLSADLLLLSPPWTIKAQGAMSLSMVIGFLYWGWIEYCFSINATYPYPIFGLLTTVQRAGLFTFSALGMTASTMALKYAYGKINGIEKFEREALKPAKMD